MTDPNIGFYSAALEDGLDDGQRVGWESMANQKLRFEALLEVLPAERWTRSLTLLDVGCGMGDLVSWIQATGRSCTYTGIDLHSGMVERARARHPGWCFEVRDLREVEEDYDVVLCSGALSIRLEDAEASWALVERMYGIARVALTLNLQSTRAFEGGVQLRNDFWMVDPVEAYARLRKIAGSLVLREDTLPSDLVGYLYAPGTCRSLESGAFSAVERAEVLLSRGEASAAHVILTGAQAEKEAMAEAARQNLLAVSASLLGLEGVGEHLRGAHELDPSNVEIADNLTTWLVTQGALEAASGVVARCVERGGGSPLRRDELRGVLHKAWLGVGEMESAERLEQTLELSVSRDRWGARRLFAIGRLREAGEAARRAMEAEPHAMDVVLTLSEIEMRRGDVTRALELSAQVLDEDPTEPTARAVALGALRGGVRLRGEARGAFEVVRGGLREHAVLGPLIARMG